jgi:hypothetical protein
MAATSNEEEKATTRSMPTKRGSCGSSWDQSTSCQLYSPHACQAPHNMGNEERGNMSTKPPGSGIKRLGKKVTW